MQQRKQPGEQGPAEEFASAFAALLDAARLNPDKVLRELRRHDQRLLVERATLYDWKNGQHLPGDEAAFLAVIRTCLEFARRHGTRPLMEDEAEWLALLRDAKQSRDSGQTSAPSGRRRRPAVHGRTAHEWGPVALGVHKAIGGNPLPAFVRRRQDDLLDAALNPAVAANRLIVLRGGSSSGKSRSAYQAISEGLLAKWRLEYPAVPAELARLLNEGIASRTVLWLREFRDYADAEGGQEVLARLARLLGGSNCIIVLTTMWERSWYAYTGDHRGGPGTRDQYPAARALLAGLPELTSPAGVDPRRGGVIDVPDELSDRDLAHAEQLDDPAIIEAIDAAASDGKPRRVIQYLAGVPDLLRQYEGPGADPRTRAMITVAIDVARMTGVRRCTPAFLRRAAAGYLADAHRAEASDAWCDIAIAHAATELRGAVRALTPIPPERGTGVESYRLADYLEQHGRKIFAETIPPPDFWIAATYSKLQADFAEAASSRGLLRTATQLAKNATSADASAAAELTRIMHRLHPDDERPYAWAAAYADLTRPGKVAKLLSALRDAGAYTHVVALLQRDPATNVDIGNSDGIAFLLHELREAEAHSQVGAIVARNPAAHADATNILGIYRLLRALHMVGADAQVAALADRAVASADWVSPPSVERSS
jgi:alkylhydroperoxidase/carboxymuconolactone decarboxylase family protein YurZ